MSCKTYLTDFLTTLLWGIRTRRRIWDEMALHEPLDFEKGYMVRVTCTT